MVLYLVGLGLSDELDITLRGLEVVKKARRVYLEAYTSILLCNKAKLEELYQKEVIVADREMVESQAEAILEGADVEDVAFLVVGDPFGATTHSDLQLRAHERCIPVRVVHNASIMNAVGACGLQLYRFGEAVSIVFFTETWRPDSFYDKIAANKAMGLHTLCLLDIKVKEPSLESLARGKPVYEEPRFMSVAVAVAQLREVEAQRGEGVCTDDALCVGLARVGAGDQRIIAGSLADLAGMDFGPPLHSLIIAGNVHPLEMELLQLHYPKATAEPVGRA